MGIIYQSAAVTGRPFRNLDFCYIQV